MTTAFPGDYDDFLNPDDTTYQDDAGFLHDLHHSNLNDAVEAVERSLGKLGETDPTSYRFRVGALEAIAAALGTMALQAAGAVAITGGTLAGITSIGTGTLSASGQITSTVADGIAPLVITSGTLVTNLNADRLDGAHGSFYLDRANHTGTQLAATISDFNTGVASAPAVTGVIADLATHIAASDPHPGYQLESQRGQANGYCDLDASGLVPISRLPALAITSTTVVASQAAQLALTAQEGDVAVRSDESKSYIHNGGTAGTMADWTLLQTPTGAVLSVFGRTGAISATSGDYTASQITNVAAGGIAAVTVQAALNELDTEKANVAGTLAQFAATTSLELATLISDDTGSGALVFANTPTLVTPVLGVATATSINKVAFTAPATGSTLTIADGATLTVNASATISNGTHSGTNTGDQTITLTGNVTGSGTGSFATTIAANAVADTMLRQSAGLSVIGRSANSTGNVTDITAGTDGHVLRLSGTTLGFGTIATAGIAAGAVTLAKMADLAQDQFIVRTTASTGVPETATCTAAARSILDDTSVPAIATTLGLGIGDSPQFTGVNIGDASDTTVTRASAGDIAVEGNRIFRVGGADVPVADGGTGGSTPADARAGIGASAEILASLTGDGTDGALVFDGSTTIAGLIPVANVYTMTVPIWGSAITVNSGVEIKTKSWRIGCQGQLLNNGTIDADGGNGGNSSGTTGGSAGAAGGDGEYGAANGGSAGQAGSTGASAVGANTTAQSGMGGRSSAAGGGGNGSGGTTAPSGAQGAKTTLNRKNLFELLSGFRFATPSLGSFQGQEGVRGGRGAGDGVNTGGGSGAPGAGGGVVAIAAGTIVNNGTISAKGGNAGNSGTPPTGNCGGGGGSGAGGGGMVLLAYKTLTNSGTISVAAGSNGTPGNGVGTGSNGAAAVGTATDGVVLKYNLTTGAWE